MRRWQWRGALGWADAAGGETPPVVTSLLVTISGPTSLVAGQNGTYAAAVQNGPVTTYVWRLDGATVGTNSPTLNVPIGAAGSRVVSVTVTAADGRTATATRNVSVSPPSSFPNPDYQSLEAYFPDLTSAQQQAYPVQDGRALTLASVGVPSGVTMTTSTNRTVTTSQANVDYQVSRVSINPGAGNRLVMRNCKFRFGSVGGFSVEVLSGHVVFIDCEFYGDTTAGSTDPYTALLLIIRSDARATTCRCLFTKSGADVVRIGGVGYRSLQDYATDLRSLPGSHRDYIQGYGADPGSLLEVYGTRVSDPTPVGSELSQGIFLDAGTDAAPITAFYRGCAFGSVSPTVAHGSQHPQATITDNWWTPYTDTSGQNLFAGGGGPAPVWTNNRWWVSGDHRDGSTVTAVTAGADIPLSLAS